MAATILNSSVAARHSAAGKYLTFTLGRESYGVPVLKIREIIRRTDITAVPQMPAHVKGVINLRGKIIPVVDLHAKFGLAASETSDHASIVVVQVRLNTQAEIQLGLQVDDVLEVVQIGNGEVEQAPDFGSRGDPSCILGIAKLKSNVAILLDIDKTLGTETAKVSALEAADQVRRDDWRAGSSPGGMAHGPAAPGNLP
jgi:purine-binding chemotaxis protein CheW